MNSIGGYFGLELRDGKEYNDSSIKLNTGRNALEYILLSKKYTKIYIPYFTCDVLLEPLHKLDISIEFYTINKLFEPIFDYKIIKKYECFLYTNYFGLNQKNVQIISKKCNNLIIDNAQAFYAKAIKGVDTFYSPRKFFGIPDGAYLYTDTEIGSNLEHQMSFTRFEHLLRRIEMGAVNGFPYFLKNDENLSDLPIMKMSLISEKLLQNIDYNFCANKRETNFDYIHSQLGELNGIKWRRMKEDIPLTYPFYTTNLELRGILTKHKIFTAQYWPNIVKLNIINSVEYDYSLNLLHLPIDQRLDKLQLDTIIKIIKDEY